MKSIHYWTLGYPSSYLFDKHDELGYFKICKEYDLEHKFGSILRSITRGLIRIIVLIILFPVFIGDFLVRKVCRLHDMYARPFENSLLMIVEENEKKILEKYTTADSDSTGDTFRLIYHYAIEHSSNHLSKMQNYVALYGFTRTLTFIGCLLFWEWIILHVIKGGRVNSLCMILTYKNFLILFGIFFITFFLYWDFNKFFRKFSMEAYLGAIVSYNKENN